MACVLRNIIRTAARHDEQPAGCLSPAPSPPWLRMKLLVRHAGGELTVGSQKEFLLLWQRGVIAADDLVRREGQERWTAAGELPWIRGMRLDARRDSRRLLWLTVALMIAGLLAALWIQGRAPQVARRSLARPSGAVRAVPR